MARLYEPEYRALREALRRWLVFYVVGGEHDKPLHKAWLGLGYKTDYKAAVDAGLMEWVHGEPQPRCEGWLRLTPTGCAIVNYWIELGYADPDNLGDDYDLIDWPPREV